MHGALAERRARQSAEVDKLVSLDKACSEFAALANPWAEWLVSLKDAVTNSNAALDKQLELVKEAEAAATDDSKLQAVLAKEVQVATNPHTVHSSSSLKLQWQQYQSFLVSKENLLKEQMHAKRLRGLSQEQYDLMFEQFNEYDKNSDKQLNFDELKSCLFAQGENRKKEEIEAILKQFGNDKKEIEFDAYVEYMVSVLGGQNTSEKVTEALTLINNGPDARIELMKDVFTKDQLEYINNTAPKTADGNLDMKAWVQAMFSR